jgi:small-conductance mechanosensitive channel
MKMKAFTSAAGLTVLINASAFGVALAAGLILAILTVATLRRHAQGTKSTFENSLAVHCAGPLKLIMPLLAADIVMPSLVMPVALDNLIRHLIALLVTFAIAWLIIRVTLVVEDLLADKFRIEPGDNLKARRVRTQFAVLRRALSVAVVVIAFGIALTTFDWARTIGTSLLASAGITGLALSLAARPTIENLVAGFQIALTDAIRIEDVVVAENEWGHIEEINTTYVVVRTWDERRLILPISYFINHPFQNWTRRTFDLLAYVYLNLDYRMPVEPLRQKFGRILEGSPLWDRRVCALQVTDASEHTIQIRALASAANASLAWDLKCEVREKLIDFVQHNYPQFLPRVRAEIDGGVDARSHATDGPWGEMSGAPEAKR